MRQIPSVYSELNLVDEKVEKIIDKNFNKLSPLLYKLLVDWFISAFSNFKDIEKYIILIYLINTDLVFYRKNGIIVDYETFYKEKTLEIPKINLINISKDLKIPKESVRRKIVSLEKAGVIKKSGKKIIIDRSAYDTVKPRETLKNISVFLSQFSKILVENKITKNSVTSENIASVIKKNFSFCWYQFYKFLFSYVKRLKKQYSDLETICIGLLILYNAVTYKEFRNKDLNLKKWRSEISNADKVGLNAMSISDISKIPRSTVIRKLKFLQKKNILKINQQKLITINFSEQELKNASKTQNEVIKDLTKLIIRIFNQINIK
tara:strand:+ start:420 stop:1382 length:963 start_codon:yes stop_codon:yes gene_type:complete